MPSDGLSKPSGRPRPRSVVIAPRRSYERRGSRKGDRQSLDAFGDRKLAAGSAQVATIWYSRARMKHHTVTVEAAGSHNREQLLKRAANSLVRASCAPPDALAVTRR